MKDKIELKGVSKSFGDVHVLDNISLSIKQNEFFVLFGPSSVGKSTILKLIAGLEYVDDGKIFIDEKDVTVEPASKRGICMAFENYALYPHLTVFENLAGVLRNKKLPKSQIDEKVHKTTRMLGIEPYLKRLPKQLSGGQKQRVSLGRALVLESEIYLLDEPLAHLDAKLRNELRTEFQSIKTSLHGATVVYVTHDYSEAMALGDRVCILYDKHIAQIDTPERVYREPANLEIARMFGQPEINVFDMDVDHKEGKLFNELQGIEFSVTDTPIQKLLESRDNNRVSFACRPRDWSYTFDAPQKKGYIEAETVGAEIRNFRTIVIVKLSDGKYLSILTDEYISVKPGRKIYLKPDLSKSYLFDSDTGVNLARMEG